MIKEQKHPKDEASFASHFFFWWELGIVLKHLKKTPVTDEAPLQEQECKMLGDRLETEWLKEQERKAPSLKRVLVRSYGAQFLLYGILFFPIDVVVVPLQSLYLSKLLNCFALGNSQAYIYGLIIGSLSFFRVLSLNFFFMQLTELGTKVKLACSALIYRKVLQMKVTTMQTATFGHITNLLSNDLERFEKSFCFVHFLWITPLHVLIGICYLCLTQSFTAALGTGVLVLYLLAQILVFKLNAHYRRRVAAKTDHRLRLMNIVISGIQAVKMYTWEKPLAKLVLNSRRSELEEITKTNSIRILNSAVISALQKIAVFVCIVPVVVARKQLTPTYIFTLINIYEMLAYFVRFLAMSIPLISEVNVSVSRIENFLLLEHEPRAEVLNAGSKPPGVVAKNVRLKWHQRLILDDIHFNLTSGELVAVVGAAGSGKTTLLHAILQEIRPDDGRLAVEGKIAYAPQNSWIFSATLRENIVFGQQFDPMKYEEVIRVCALEQDLLLFPHGDNTLVGERGVMLSGGQKARINLARAVYQTADIYLLDDPLSSVDTLVAGHIFNQCILKYLKRKCVVLVTHQTQFLANVDRVYAIENGHMRVQDCRKIMPNSQETSVNLIASPTRTDTPKDVVVNESSSVTSPYNIYIRESGIIATCLQLLIFVAVQFIMSSIDYFISFWANLSGNNSEKMNNTCLWIYTSLICALLIFGVVNSFAYVQHCKRASINLHQSLLRRILSGSMQFFDNHSSGRILNRFAYDMGLVDEFIPMCSADVIRYFLLLSAAYVLIIIANYWMVIPTLGLILLFYLYSKLFEPALQNYKVMEATRRSPILSHFSATMQGLSVIKAAEAEEHMTSQFHTFQNRHNSVNYLFKALHYSHSFWVDFTCALYIVLEIFLLLFLDSGVHIGSIGLAVTQSLSLVGPAQYLTKLCSKLDMQITSVERVADYKDVMQERDKGKLIPEKSWPKLANISFESVSMRYAPHKPLVLNQINLAIKSGEKVGIIGRTGAGKSTLISTLFRLFDFDGVIRIDDVDIKSVPLSILRSRILIISQEPVLFLGTIRQNLDPFGEFQDDTLWSVLEEADLKKWVSTLSSGLETQVLEGGSNFSVGQKQLLCLVRAVLKKAKVVVLDEATANLDCETDRLIQTIVRKKFEDATVLTVAHRLNTVMDSDKIVVMESGAVVEFGEPQQLLSDTNSDFYRRVHENVQQ